MFRKPEMQYYHDEQQQYTVAVDIDFQRIDLETILHDPKLHLKLKVGVSYKHPDDLYCKQTGREVSYSKLESIIMKLETILVEEGTSRLVYTLHNKTTGLRLQFRTSPKSNKPHLLFAQNDIGLEKQQELATYF